MGWSVSVSEMMDKEFAHLDRLFDGALVSARDKFLRLLNDAAEQPSRQAMIIKQLVNRSEAIGSGHYAYRCTHGDLVMHFFVSSEDRFAHIYGFLPREFGVH